MVEAPLVDFLLPSLGSDMEEGTIIEWMVELGDHVAKGDTLLAVETEKGDIDVETWDGGVVAEICAPVGATVSVGTVIARLASREDQPDSTAPGSVDARDDSPPARIPPSEPAPREPPTRGAGSPLVSPRLVYWPGPPASPSSPSPRPTATPTPTPTRDEVGAEIEDPMRRAVARTMSRANREIPHYHLTHEIDLEQAQRWLSRHNETVGVAERVVMAALLTKATARAARAVPELNGHWTARGLELADEVNVALIVRRRDGGIVAPVLHRADELMIGEVMTSMTDLVTRSRRGDLSAGDLADPTITITNLGERGVGSVLGVIHPPQVALAGFGRPDVRPRVVDGVVEPRLTVVATLSGDHRATDGQTGARFLRAIEQALQEPDSL